MKHLLAILLLCSPASAGEYPSRYELLLELQDIQDELWRLRRDQYYRDIEQDLERERRYSDCVYAADTALARGHLKPWEYYQRLDTCQWRLK